MNKENKMKYLKMLGLAAVAAMALMAVGAGSASATTLTKTGVTQSTSVTITASLEPGTTALLATTSGGFANTCSESHVHGETVAPFSGAVIGGPITELSFSGCTTSPVVVDTMGSLSIERIGATNNGTVRSAGAKVTVPSPFGPLTCSTGAGTDIGTLTGSSTGAGTMDIKAVLNCGFLVPSAKWEGSYIVTEPHSLGVTG
jgi:hypothetical protein